MMSSLLFCVTDYSPTRGGCLSDYSAKTGTLEGAGAFSAVNFFGKI